MEFHPRIDSTTPLIVQDKIILGSFPIWSLTNSRPTDAALNALKKEERIKNKEIEFFYGSAGNKFWSWYRIFVDPELSIRDHNAIKKSLNNYSIGITDLIVSCTRKDRSSYDKDLNNRTYNHSFLKIPQRGKKIKILCTSKGVMNEMLLNKLFFAKHTELKINSSKSLEFQREVLGKIKGKPSLVTKPFFQILESTNGGVIECFSTPSPGSPYRKLDAFGFNSKNSDDYLNSYLLIVFEWLKNN